MGNLEIRPALEGVKGKSDDPAKLRKAAEDCIAEVGADVVIYSDGSAIEGYREGGAAIVVEMKDDPPREETLMRKGAFVTSSYQEECSAMMTAAEWIRDNCDHRTRVLIMTDSQSLCIGLLGKNTNLNSLRKMLDQTQANITLQWIPSHVGIEGNEKVDSAANKAREIEGEWRPITYKGLFPMIKRLIKDQPCREKYSYLNEVYKAFSTKKDAAITCRWDSVDLARLRSNHHWSLYWYQNFIKDEISPRCRRCNYEKEDTNHIFKCPGTVALRMELFGRVDLPLSTLTDEPKLSLALARRFLRGVPTTHQKNKKKKNTCINLIAQLQFERFQEGLRISNYKSLKNTF